MALMMLTTRPGDVESIATSDFEIEKQDQINVDSPKCSIINLE